MSTPAGPGLDVRVLGAVMLAIVLVVAVIAWQMARRRKARSVSHRLSAASQEVLAGALLPDAEGGQIHIQYLALTRRDILVVDYRDVAGHVFGSESMQEWTVLGRKSRTTFANPLPALYDRVAAVRRIAPGRPVRGVVAFGARALFSKGFPPNVVMLDALLADLSADGPEPDAALAEAIRSGWESLRTQARRD